MTKSASRDERLLWSDDDKGSNLDWLDLPERVEPA
jgi:hypothetical protein